MAVQVLHIFTWEGHIVEHRLPGQGKCTEHHQLGPLNASTGKETMNYSDGSGREPRNAWSGMAGGEEPATVPLSSGLSRRTAAASHWPFILPAPYLWGQLTC